MLGGIIDVVLQADSKKFDNALNSSANKLSKFKTQAGDGGVFKSAVDTAGDKISGLIGKIGGAVIAFGSLHHIVSEVGAKLNEISALDKLSNRLGMSIEGIETLQFALKKAGLSADEVEPMFDKLQNHISQASMGSAEARQAFDELGLNFKTLKGEAPEQQFKDISDAIAKVPAQSDRIRLLMELFGKSGGELESVFRKGSAGLDEMKSKMDKFGTSVSPIDAAQVAEATKAMHDYSMIWEGVWTKTTTSFAPDIAAAYSLITDSILDTKDGSSLLNQVLELGHDAWNFVIEVGYKAYNVFKATRGAISELISELAALASHIPLLSKETKAWLQSFSDDLHKSANKDVNEALDGWNKSAVKMLEQRKKANEEKAKANLAQREHDRKSSQQAASQDGFSRPLNELIIKYKEEADTLFMTTRQKEVYLAAQKAGNVAMQGQAASYASYLEALETEKKLLENDPLYSYNKKIDELDNALKHGTITWKEYNKAVAEAMKTAFQIPPSVDQQIDEWKEKLDTLRKMTGITADQRAQAEKNSMPEFIKSLYDSTRTPMEKFQQDMTQLMQWKGKISDDLFNRGIMQALNNAGIGEHKLAQAATYNSTEARNVLMAGRVKRDDTAILQSLKGLNEQQLKAQLDQLAGINKLANNTATIMVIP